MADLDALFRPTSIAVIGASNRPQTLGHRILTNLQKYGFRGAITPVNPKGGEILGKQAAKSILEVPGQVDLVHIIVRNHLVASTLKDCAEKGVKAAIINTSGFKETGSPGDRMEQELVEIGRQTGIRLFGPNCQGVMNSDPEVSLYSNFTFAAMRPGHVSLVAQGGGVAEVINNYFGMHQVGQRMVASNGNACDISVPEIVEYYGQDPETRVIVLHAESFADPREFLHRVAPVAAKKPVLALKSGTTQEGARAVCSHTGGLMEQDAITDVLFDKCGVLRFADLDELCQAAQVFAVQKVPRGNRVGVLTNAGSVAIIVTDRAVRAGLQVPDLGPSTKDFLKARLQSIASIANPIDMMATASGQEFFASLQALMDDPGLDAVVVCFMTPFFVDTLGIARAVCDQAKRSDKTLIAVAMTNPQENPEWKQTVDLVRQAGVPVFYFPEAAAWALAAMDSYRRLRDRPRRPAPELKVDRIQASRLVKDVDLDPEGFMLPKDASSLLSLYGIPMVAERRAGTWEALRTAARQVGYPVVLKAEAPELVHKTDAGAVVLGLTDGAALREAYQSLSTKLSGLKQLGFLVQKHLEQGLEVIVGGARAPGLGSTVMFGLGGIHVEVFKDVVFKLAPLCEPEALEMLDGIVAKKLLDGTRGRPAIDRRALVDILLRVSSLLVDHPEVFELDLNPIMAYPEGVHTKVVDARIKLGA